jgi:hypothetical protein
MNHETRLGSGPLIAAACAGPLFTGVLFTGLYYVELPQAVPVSEDILYVLPGMYLLSTIAGFFIAILPVLTGATIMGVIGKHTQLSRTPALWACVGAGIPAVVALLLWASDPGNIDSPQSGAFVVAFVVTGGICALICRRHVRWVDAEPGEIHSPARISVRAAAVDPRLLR